jgi:hypothetical protein
LSSDYDRYERIAAHCVTKIPSSVLYQLQPPDWRRDRQFADEPLYQPTWIESENTKLGIIDCHNASFGAEVAMAAGRNIKIHGDRMVANASTAGQGANRSTRLNRTQIGQEADCASIRGIEFNRLKPIATRLREVA